MVVVTRSIGVDGGEIGEEETWRSEGMGGEKKATWWSAEARVWLGGFRFSGSWSLATTCTVL